jgi:hypothetical protein
VFSSIPPSFELVEICVECLPMAKAFGIHELDVTPRLLQYSVSVKQNVVNWSNCQCFFSGGFACTVRVCMYAAPFTILGALSDGGPSSLWLRKLLSLPLIFRFNSCFFVLFNKHNRIKSEEGKREGIHLS